MSKRSIFVLATLTVIFSAGSAFAANSLDVNMPAAIEGVYGLEVLVDGADSANAVYVQDATPESEEVYRATFRIAHHDLAMNEDDGHAIMMGRMLGGNGNIIRLYMKRQGGTYKLRCRWKKNLAITGTGFCGQFTFAPVNTLVTVEWIKGADGASNGRVRLTKGTNVQADRTDLANDDFDIDTLRLGLPQGIPAGDGTAGSYYIDDFQSFRTLAP
jgi:hypothetical protein